MLIGYMSVSKQGLQLPLDVFQKKDQFMIECDNPVKLIYYNTQKPMNWNKLCRRLPCPFLIYGPGFISLVSLIVNYFLTRKTALFIFLIEHSLFGVGWCVHIRENCKKVLGSKIKIGYAWQAKIEICYGIIFLTL